MDVTIAGFLKLLEIIDQLEIRYFIGGSVASGIHGIPRFTRDVDFVVDLDPDLLPEFSRLLGAAFYHDLETIERAVSLRRPFNIIHIASAYKYDFYPAQNDDFASAQLGRRREELGNPFGIGEDIEFFVSTPEDTLLSKLRWFHLRGRQSQYQWDDMRGILSRKRDRLDYDYLRRWAERFALADLLDELLASPPPHGE